MSGHLKTRNIVVDGRRTSVRLEPEYWQALDDMAAATGRDISQIFAAAAPHHGRADTLRLPRETAPIAASGG